MILDRTHLPLLDEFKHHSWRNRMTQHEWNTWNSIEHEIYKGSPGVYVSAELNAAGNIDLLNVSYTVNSLWGLKRNSIGDWVIGLTRARDISTKVRTYQIERLIWPVMQIMESEGRFSFYMVRRIPSRVYWHNVEEYLTSRHPEIGNIDRYDSRAIHILKTPTELEKLPRLFQQLTPLEWPANRHIAILRHELKYKNRI
jgi:hypothetical protein